jgi:hypothetical protein
MSVETNCKNCGVLINIEKTIFNKSKHKSFFCCKRCNKEWNLSNLNARKIQYANLVKVYCASCGKEMLYSEYRKKLSHHFYCSAECKSSWISENQSGENHIQWSRVLVECSYCGREIYVTKRKSKKNKNFFCSREHKGLWMSDNYTGENSPVYIDSKLRNEREEFNMSLEARNLRSKIHNRDKHICQFCGERTRHAHMHHIEPFSINKDRRGDIDNVVTLCPNCHKRSHMKNTVENYIFSYYTGSQLKRKIHNDVAPKSFSECMDRLIAYRTKTMLCPECQSKSISHDSGCVTCQSCGWSICSI